MELLQLKYFCEAAEMLNISRAAKLNKVPASGVSSSIKRLEQELGVELFVRYSNKVKLTEQGQFFYEEATRILNELDNARSRIAMTGILTGKVSIAVMACENLVEKAVIEFQKQYPNVSFELYSTSKQSGNTDFYVSDEMFYIRGCVKKQLVEEKILLLLPKSHPLASKDEISVKDLKKEKFVCTNQGTILHHRLSSLCFENGFIPDVAVTVTSSKRALKYIEEGCCIGIFPETDVEKSDNIVLKSLDFANRRVCVFYNENRLVTKVNQLFLDKLLEVSGH